MAGSFPSFEQRGWGLDVQLGEERHVHGPRASTPRRMTPRVPAYLELVAPDRSDRSVADLAAMLEHVADQTELAAPETVARFLLEAERTGPIPSARPELPDGLVRGHRVRAFLACAAVRPVVYVDRPIYMYRAHADQMSSGDGYRDSASEVHAFVNERARLVTDLLA